jgi:RNA polymerase sigma-70 factor (ECF subfamily)
MPTQERRDVRTDAEKREEQALVAAVLRGERAAFQTLFLNNQRGLYYLCFRITGNATEAQDLCQRAFLNAFEKLSQFRLGSSFVAWLYRIAINLSKNYLRDSAHRGEVLFEDDSLCRSESTNSLESLLLQESREELAMVVQQLSPQQRVVVQLRIYEDLSFAEVAGVMECTENNAKVHFHHAIKKLRHLLLEKGRTQ